MFRRSHGVLRIIVLAACAMALIPCSVLAACAPTSRDGPEQPPFPDDLSALDARAEAAYAAKDYAVAEPIFRDLLGQAEARLGPAHQKTIEARYDLGMSIFQRYPLEDPRFAEAGSLLTAFAEGEEALLGSQHVVSGSAWSQVARIRQQSGDLAGALAAAAKASAILDVAVCPTGEAALDELAFRAAAMTEDDPAGAAPLYLDLYHRKLTLTPTARDTLVAGRRAARTLERLGRAAQSIALFQEVLPGLLALGADDEDALIGQRSLAILLDANDRRAEAEPLFREIVTSRQRTAGPDDPKTLEAEVELAEVLRDQEKLAEAEAFYRRVMGVREKTLGSADPATNAVRSEVARLVRRGVGRWQEAADLSRAA